MKFLRFTVGLGVITAALISCNQDDGSDAAAGNSLLSLVPADSAYVFANLEPVPADVIDAHLQRAQPLFDHAQSMLEEKRQDIESGHEDVDEEQAKVLIALLDEFDGKLNREGIESMGLSLESVNVLYGNGMFPVARLGLSDAEKLRAMIARVETNSGQEIPEHQSGTDRYWKIADDHKNLGIYIAILSDHVAISAAPSTVEAEFLPEFLGQSKPARSIADTGTLVKLNREHEFLPYGSGFMDIQRVTDEMLLAESRTSTYMEAMGASSKANMDPVCKEEARMVSQIVPRMVAGTTEFTTDAIGLRYQVEMESGLSGELASLVAEVPTAARETGLVLAAALGIKVGGLRELLLEKVTYMTANPFKCPQMAGVNEQIMAMSTTLNQPMPPFIGNLKGFRAELLEFDPVDPQPENMKGMLSLEVASPQMLIGMASMFLPGFAELGIEPGADPVQIPQELMTIMTPEIEVHAIMTSDAIGVSLGREQMEGLVPFMEHDEDNDAVFFSIDYDMAALATLEDAGNRMASADNGNSADAANDDNYQAELELMEAYKEMMGRSRTELSFDGDGLTMDTRMTFK